VIASASGKGSKARRERLLSELLGRAGEVEAKYIIKNIFGEMQHGVGEGVMMDAIAKAAGVNTALVRRASMFSGDLGQATP